MTDERPLDAWLRAGRSRVTAATARVQALTGRHPGTATRLTSGWRRFRRLLPLLLVLLVVGIDVLLGRPGQPLLLRAVLDETAHLATTLLLLGGLLATGIRVSVSFAVAAVAASQLLDVDHLPGLLAGGGTLPAERPVTHSVVTVLLLVAVGRLLADGRWLALPSWVAPLQLGLGAGFGVVTHLARDVSAGEGTPVFWPFSDAAVLLPWWVYLGALLAAALGWAAVPRRPGRPAPGLTAGASRAVVGTVTVLYAGHLAATMLTRLDTFRLAGYDTGIFAQGTYLLSRGQHPFVTVRGLDLLGDHASFILLPVSLIYEGPGTLLVLQAVGVALAAPALNALLLRRLPVGPATVFPLVYLAYPGQQWGATFEFHPESLAPGLLVLGLHLGLHARRPWWAALPLGLALLCKEDVAFVVAGIGLLFLVLGHRKRGLVTVGASALWFLTATFVLLPRLGSGEGSIYFGKTFELDPDAEGFTWLSVPSTLLAQAFEHAAGDQGLLYLALVLLPVGGLCLLSPKWLLPAAGPLLVNLASVDDALQSVRFHYLLTAAPFIVLAAAFGYHRLTSGSSGRRAAAVLAGVGLLAVVFSAERGALGWIAEDAAKTPAATVATGHRAIALVPDDAAVATSWNLTPNLADRRLVYELPVPWERGWWGREPTPQEEQAVDYVLLQRSTLRDQDRATVAGLEGSPRWEAVVDEDDILLLRRR